MGVSEYIIISSLNSGQTIILKSASWVCVISGTNRKTQSQLPVSNQEIGELQNVIDILSFNLQQACETKLHISACPLYKQSKAKHPSLTRAWHTRYWLEASCTLNISLKHHWWNKEKRPSSNLCKGSLTKSMVSSSCKMIQQTLT